MKAYGENARKGKVVTENENENKGVGFGGICLFLSFLFCFSAAPLLVFFLSFFFFFFHFISLIASFCDTSPSPLCSIGLGRNYFGCFHFLRCLSPESVCGPIDTCPMISPAPPEAPVFSCLSWTRCFLSPLSLLLHYSPSPPPAFLS